MTHALPRDRGRSWRAASWRAASWLAVTCLVTCLAVTSLALVGHAQAQAVPTCEGEDTADAAAAIEEGDRAVDRASIAMRRHHDDEATAAWTAALEAYDRACAAGAGVALERRAIPLFRLGHADRAAASLDHYLAVHPLESLDRALARRIQANQRAILRRVATLVITPRPAHAAIVVDGVVRGQGLLRVRVPAETNVVIEAHAADHEPYRLASTYGVGEHVLEVVLEPSHGAAPVEEAPVVVAPTPPAPVLLTPLAPAPPPRSRPIGLVIGGIAAGVLALVGLTFGVTSLVFDAAGNGEVLVGGPDSQVLNGIIFLSVGVGLTIGSISLFAVYAGMPDGASSPRAARVGCAASLSSLRCSF